MKGARLILLAHVRQPLPLLRTSVRGYSESGEGKKKQLDFISGLNSALGKGANADATSNGEGATAKKPSEGGPLELLAAIINEQKREAPPPRTYSAHSPSPPTRTPIFRRITLTELKHFKLYPKTIKEWVIDCKTPKGVWETDGTWRMTQSLDNETITETSAETAAQTREREILLGSKVLPADLRNRYRFGVTEEDIKELRLKTPQQENKLKEILSYKYAGRAEINQFRIAESLKKWSRKGNDTGSSEVQVLTEKIRYMSDHLRQHHKDQRTKRALGITIDKRRALLKHLKKQNVATYYNLLRDLNLRDMVSI